MYIWTEVHTNGRKTRSLYHAMSEAGMTKSISFETDMMAEVFTKI